MSQFRKICSITLNPVRHADFSRMIDGCHWPCSVRMMTREQWRSSLSMCSFISKKRCGTWLMHQSPQTKQCRPLPSNRCCFWFQNCLYVYHREYNPRFILIVEQKQNGNLILTATVRIIQCRLFTDLLQARLQTPQYIYRYVILWYVPYIICVHITTWLITYKQ